MEESKVYILKLFNGMSLSEEGLESLSEKLVKLVVPKGTRILSADEQVKYQYYVVEGCLRTFFIDKFDKEHTLQFGIEDWWVSDYNAFFTKSRATLNIECIKDAILLKVSQDDMNFLYKSVNGFESFMRQKLEKGYASLQRRILGSLSQSARERYIAFVESYPNIERCVKNYHIASYLGITTETLSRVRREISQQ